MIFFHEILRHVDDVNWGNSHLFNLIELYSSLWIQDTNIVEIVIFKIQNKFPYRVLIFHLQEQRFLWRRHLYHCHWVVSDSIGLEKVTKQGNSNLFIKCFSHNSFCKTFKDSRTTMTSGFDSVFSKTTLGKGFIENEICGTCTT